MASGIAESPASIRTKGRSSKLPHLTSENEAGGGAEGGHHTQREGKGQHDLGALFLTLTSIPSLWRNARLDESVSGPS